MSNSLWHFIVHLRWHYQLLILSGGYLLGGVLSSSMAWPFFWLQFLNVHLLLFGGATAYNSYWDEDEGPVGGLRTPPPMQPWMWSASLLLQALGGIIALFGGLVFTCVYMMSAFLFWLYSTPLARWKGTPLRSLVAIGISTGTNSVLMGYLAAGNGTLPPTVWVASIGVACMVLSLYPVSQIYQMDEDRRRGDVTFALRFGTRGVLRFFAAAFGAGVLLVALSIGSAIGWVFGVMGGVVGAGIYYQFQSLSAAQDDYHTVMNIKYGTSLAFVLLLCILLTIKYLYPSVLHAYMMPH